MCGRKVILRLAFTGVLAVMLTGAELGAEVPPVSESQVELPPPGFIEQGQREPIHKFRQMREHLERLRMEAHKAEEKAEHLWAEVDKIQEELTREFGDMERAEDAQQVHAEVAELMEAAESAEREGRHEETQRFRAEAEEIERTMHREFERHEIELHLEGMHAELAELMETAECAEQQGHHAEAAELRRKAHRLEMEIERTAKRTKLRDLRQEIKHLRVSAKRAKQAGHDEEAKALLREAKERERHLQEIIGAGEVAAQQRQLREMIEELRGQVRRLRREVGQLKRSMTEERQQ